jgi:hypothetical protein
MMKKTFIRMRIGIVSHVEFVEQKRRDGKLAHKKAYVYFERLYENAGAGPIIDDITHDGSARIYYANTPHVYWILLKNTRKPTPTSKSIVVMEDIDDVEDLNDDMESVSVEHQYTDEELAFVPEEDCSFVHSDYAYALEEQLAQMREENQQLQANAQIMFGYYNQAIAANNQLQDIHVVWSELLASNQIDRLRNIVLRGENIRMCPGSDHEGCGTKLNFDNEMCDECLVAHQNTEDFSEVSVEI